MGRRQDKYEDPYYVDMRMTRNPGNSASNYRKVPRDAYGNPSRGYVQENGRYGTEHSGRNAARPAQNRSGSGGRNTAPRGNNRGNTKRRRKKRRIKFIICLILFLILAVACVVGGLYLYQNLGRGLRAPEIQVDLETLDSPYAVMIDNVSGKVVGSKRGDEVIYPASMTKVLTVLTAIEHIDKLDTTIQMSYDYYDSLYAADASRAGFEPGEDAVIRDLLYGAMLPSGAECCMELSIQAAGSEAAFVDLMNQKVQELGLTQTHFTNSTGLHNDQQYTTPHEMALILKEALKNKTFREVFTTSAYTVGATAVHPDGFTFQSSMFKNMQSPTVINGEIKGGKTGFTNSAGYCLVSMAEIDGREYIQVTAGWAENPRTSIYHINDAYLGYNLVGRATSDN